MKNAQMIKKAAALIQLRKSTEKEIVDIAAKLMGISEQRVYEWKGVPQLEAAEKYLQNEIVAMVASEAANEN